jgi:plasmid stabilization system protein ParE
MENSTPYSIVLSKKAEQEIQTSWVWYEDRQKGLGDYFLNELLKKFHKIETHPELYALKSKSYRETKIDTFPILIIYRLNKRNRAITVVSVFHTSRHPRGKYKV